jgi:hypothetical protein
MSGEKKMPSAIVRGRSLRLLFGNRWPGDPSGDQSEEQIRAYYTSASEGDVAVIRQTYANHLFFIVSIVWSRLFLKQLGGHAEASFTRVPERRHHRRRYTSFTFLSGRLRIGLPVAAKTALSTAGATTQIVGSPTPPQKSEVGTITVSTFGISARRIIS